MLPPQGVGYGLVAAVAWGLLLVARKRLFATIPSTVFMTGSFYAAVVLYLPVAGAVDPSGFAVPSVTARQAVVVFGTLVGIAVGLLLVFVAVDLGEVSYVTPISKVTPVFVLPLEVVVFGEWFSASAVAGIVLTTIAVYVASLETASVLQPVQKLLMSRPAHLALGSAIVVAFVNLGQRSVLQGVQLDPTLWVGMKLLGVPIVLTPFAIRNWRGLSWASGRRLLAVGALVAVAEYFISLAFSSLPASIATPLVGLQAVVAALLGGVWLNENYTGVRLVAAVVAVAGIGLISAV